MKSFPTILRIALGAVLLLSGRVVYAQGGSNPLDPEIQKSKFLVGPVIGINRNFHTGGFKTITEDETCPKFEKGSGWGFLAGITAEFQLGETWSIIPRLTYESRPGSFTSELPSALVLLPGTNEVVPQTVTAASEVTYSIANAEVMYKQEFADLGGMRLALAGGPAIAVVLGGKNRQVQDLVTPENARFTNPSGFPSENNGRRLIFFDGDIPSRSGTRISLKAGMQAEFGLFGNAWIMTPGIYYDYGISDVTSAENWQLNTLMFMVDFRRAF